MILQINFYSGTETIVKVGESNEDYVKARAGRVETFEIAEDEKLIGCKLDFKACKGDFNSN